MIGKDKEKIMRKFAIWILLSIALQMVVYLYLDRVVLVPTVHYSEHAISAEHKLPSGTYNYSHDMSCYAVVSGGRVGIYATTGNKLLREIKLRRGESLSYFSWLPDKNIALLGINRLGRRESSVVLKQIDLETNSHPIEPKISGLMRGARISSVAYSAETNVIYILVKNGITSAVFRTDANNNLRSVHTGYYHIGRIASLNQDDILLYDNLDNSSVYALDFIRGKREKISPTKGKYMLIGVDMSDNIYIGRLNDHRLIDTILIGKFNRKFLEYRKLDYPYPEDSIKVTYDGKLLFT